MVTNSLYDFASYVFTLLDDNKASLGVLAVYYGDQDKLPTTPALCVEPEQKENTLKTANRGLEINFTVYVYVYYGAIDSVQNNKRQADQLGEQVETLLHQDATCGGKVIHSYVTMIESGYSQKSGSILRSSRITFTGVSTNRLPAAL